jgi:hypothetical protein
MSFSSFTSLPSGGLKFTSSKRQVDTLFLFHAIFSLFLGTVAVLTPHIWEFFMINHAGEQLRLFGVTKNDDQKAAHLIVRLFGCLIISQAWIVWSARSITEPLVRRALVQAYAFAFTLMTLSLLRAQLTESLFSTLHWINIIVFAVLSMFYSNFAFIQPIKVFEGLGKAGK